MVPEGIIDIAQLVAQGSLVSASLVMAIYALVAPRIPEIRRAIMEEETTRLQGLRKIIEGPGKERFLEEDVKHIQDEISARQAYLENLDQKLSSASLASFVYWPLLFSAISFPSCLLAVDNATLGAAAGESVVATGFLDFAWNCLFIAGFTCGVSFLMILVSLGELQKIIDIAEEARKAPPREFERFRP
jgi:hypothetical protein